MAKVKKIERKAEQLAEIKKCGSDPVYFINKYVKISSTEAFHTFAYQNDCIESFLEHRFTIVNKSRQLGLSTVSAAFSLWLALFRRDQCIVVIATKLEIAKNFISKVKFMFDSLPSWLVLPEVEGESVKYLKFSNNSQIIAIPTSADAGRSYAITFLVIDEAAHIENFEELWTGLVPTLSATRGKAVLISSPLGVGSLFHRLWMGASEGTNDFNAIELPWQVRPDRDEAWFNQEVKNANGDMRLIAQEYLCSFSSSGYTFLDADSLKWVHETAQSPIARYGPDLDMHIWEYELPGHKYIISADVARGDSEDYSAFHVFDAMTNRVVADFKGKIQPDKFGRFLVEIAKKYNNAFIVHEMNNSGQVTSYELKNLGYTNVYYEKLFEGNIDVKYTTEQIGELLPGFTTSVATRPKVIAKMDALIKNRSIVLRSERLAKEFQTFIVVGDKPRSQKGANDDLIMSLAIGCNFLGYATAQLNNNYDPMALILGISKSSKTLAQITRPTNVGWGISGADLPSKSGWTGMGQQQGRQTPQQNVDMYKTFDWLFK